MIRINENYSKLTSSYLFAEIAKRVKEFEQRYPEKNLIKMGIGDVTKPLPSVCIQAFHKAVDEMSKSETFKGYGPYEGYDFLRDAIAEHDYKKRGTIIDSDEIFVSDGAKTDTGSILDILSNDLKIAIPDPVYPVYIDTNVMAGHTGEYENGRYKGIIYLDSNQANHYVPTIPKEHCDLIYLCFPNNPTGATINREQLKNWVDYAKEHKALILYDAAYVCFIRDEAIPQSIYEIDGAKEVAIEFRSYSKTAGFTGTRCAYMVIPRVLKAYDRGGASFSLHSLWSRRCSTKNNGVSYPVQCAAAALYTPEGIKQVKEYSDYYLRNASYIRNKIDSFGFHCVGGLQSPYIWVKAGVNSWEFFDLLLNKAGVVCTPGSGFGSCGEGYIRFSSFNSYENSCQAMERLSQIL